MFRLRQQHLDSFDQAAWQHFVQVAKTELRTHHSPRFGQVSDAELESFVRQQQVHAAEYDLESEYAVLNFLHLVALLGPSFAEHPEHAGIIEQLEDDDADENERAESALDLALQFTNSTAEVRNG